MELFIKLRKIAREFNDQSKPGLANWSAEAIQGDDVICYHQYDAGYTQRLSSIKFGFVVWELNSNTETKYRFDIGSEVEMMACLEYLHGK